MDNKPVEFAEVCNTFYFQGLSAFKDFQKSDSKVVFWKLLRLSFPASQTAHLE